MVTVGLMTLIVLGLLAMFNQTQRAFRSSMTQVDVLESGRAVTEMLARELEQMVASQGGAVNNGTYLSTNFFAEVHYAFTEPAVQGLPGATGLRSNIVQRFFFITHQNQDWTGTGFQVAPDYTVAGRGLGTVGTLYRFATNTSKYGTVYLSGQFEDTMRRAALSGRYTNSTLSRIADGVVHLRLRAFDTYGRLITPAFGNYPPQPGTLLSTVWQWDVGDPNYNSFYINDQIDYYFRSNAVPAYLELELGILEPRTLERLRSLVSNPSDPNQVPNARTYLSNHVAQVHIFRQRIAVRNVDYAAYQQP